MTPVTAAERTEDENRAAATGSGDAADGAYRRNNRTHHIIWNTDADNRRHPLRATTTDARGRQHSMLELNHITKSFGDDRVLDDINLRLDTGAIMSILGPSGGGKTTLLNIILGIIDADDGQIIFDGEDITHTPMEKRGFNIVFQDYALFPNLNAYENITYGLRNNPGLSSPEEISNLVALLDLDNHLDKSVDELSGGQKQRVALARTLVMKPRLLLLDEPLSALDGVIKESVKTKIKQIVDRYRLTTIMVTHDPEEACTMSDRVLILNRGKVAQFGTPDEIINQPADGFVQSFILNQLEVKRDNIHTLFADRDTDMAPATQTSTIAKEA